MASIDVLSLNHLRERLLPGAHIDEDAETLRSGARQLPTQCAGLMRDDEVELVRGAALGHEGLKRCGRGDPARRVSPAGECFDGDDLACVRVEQGLAPRFELVVVERPA